MNRLVVVSIVALCIAAAANLPATVLAEQQDGAAHQPEAKFLDMSAVPTLSPDRLAKVQQALQKKGFNTGPVDGILGPMTKEAVRSFQERYGMNPSGEIDNQTLYALGGAELASRPDGN